MEQDLWDKDPKQAADWADAILKTKLLKNKIHKDHSEVPSDAEAAEVSVAAVSEEIGKRIQIITLRNNHYEACFSFGWK